MSGLTSELLEKARHIGVESAGPQASDVDVDVVGRFSHEAIDAIKKHRLLAHHLQRRPVANPVAPL
jgi:hypothetical protein